MEESEGLLQGIAEKWELLIWFYFSQGMHQQALEWLEDAHDERRRAPYPGEQVRAEKTVEYFQHLLEAAAVNQVLQHRPAPSRAHYKLVNAYAAWVLAKDAELAIEIFTRGSPVAAIAIEPAAVLKVFAQELNVRGDDGEIAETIEYLEASARYLEYVLLSLPNSVMELPRDQAGAFFNSMPEDAMSWQALGSRQSTLVCTIRA